MSKSLTKEYDFRGNVKSVDYQGFSKYKNCATYVIPAASLAAANKALENLGWPGPGNFNVPLKSGLLRLVTHHACFVRLNDVQKAEWEAAIALFSYEKYENQTIKECCERSGRDIKVATRPRSGPLR